ncbi:MAG: hypothetical protein BGO90_12670 [Legionella sp. 40-6]|nr:MAG: hypothetical protein BGO90_12670 [Legionella sp. 40-6]
MIQSNEINIFHIKKYLLISLNSFTPFYNHLDSNACLPLLAAESNHYHELIHVVIRAQTIVAEHSLDVVIGKKDANH